MSGKKKVKKLSATNKELSKEITTLRSRLTRTEARLARTEERAKRWKTETTAARTAASRSDARAEKLQRKLDRAVTTLEPAKRTAPAEAAATNRPAAEATTPDGVTVPDCDLDRRPAPSRSPCPRADRAVGQAEGADPRRPDLSRDACLTSGSSRAAASA